MLLEPGLWWKPASKIPSSFLAVFYSLSTESISKQ